MALPLLAIPVLHSSGAWIASSGGVYVAGTLSNLWIASFVAGNTTLIGSLATATAGTGALLKLGPSGIAASAKSALALAKATSLTKVGLAGLAANSLKGAWNAKRVVAVAPVAATAPFWIIASAGILSVSAAAFYLLKKSMKTLNEERQKGGLKPISIRDLINQIREYHQSQGQA